MSVVALSGLVAGVLSHPTQRARVLGLLAHSTTPASPNPTVALTPPRNGGLRLASHVPALGAAGDPEGRPGSPSAADAPANAGAPVGPRRVQLEVTGTSSAEVQLDGRPVGHVPLALSLPATAEDHLIVVDREGYNRWSRKVAGDKSTSVVAILRRKETPAPRPSARATIYDPFSK
jgi:hypothetical protein